MFLESNKNIEILVDEVPNPKGNILFIHGFTGNFNNKINFRNYFYDYNFYSLNLPGHGDSKFDSLDELNTKYFVNIIINFIEFYNLNELIILGHSMGGGLAIVVANQAMKKVKMLILEAPANKNVFINYDSVVSKLIPKDFDETKYIYSKLLYDPYFLFKNDVIYNKFLTNEFNKLTQKYSNLSIMLEKDAMNDFFNEIDISLSNLINLPILLVIGDKDEIVPFEKTKEYFDQKNIGNSNYLSIVAKNCAHLPLTENKHILDDVKNFINKYK